MCIRDRAKREDLAQIERDEMAVLEIYLPKRMSQEEVNVAVKALVGQLGATGPADMGRVMAAAKSEFTGKAEMSHVSLAVKAALNP